MSLFCRPSTIPIVLRLVEKFFATDSAETGLEKSYGFTPISDPDDLGDHLKVLGSVKVLSIRNLGGRN